MFEESAKECDAAIALDPGNYQLRSCSLVFDMLGKTNRAMDFLRLDTGSQWAMSNLPEHFQRAGNMEEARKAAQQLSLIGSYEIYEKACYTQAPAAERAKASRVFLPDALSDPDPENRYWSAALLAACAEPGPALKLLKTSIEGNYCAYIPMQTDPLMASLRGTPEFGQLLAAAKQCRDRFQAGRDR